MTPFMQATVEALLTPGKGILALDESFPTIEKRFKEHGIPSTEENRLNYRQMLVSTPGLNQFISGVILFDETLHQSTRDAVTIPEYLRKRGIVTGIKVDQGTVALANSPREKTTQGLDGLRSRLIEYRKLGARFTKWRAVISIGRWLPTMACLDANARALGRFASLSQEAGLVPIVEPEVMMDGDHTLERCEEVMAATLTNVFSALADHRVVLDGMLLKTGMVLPGRDCPKQVDDKTIAIATLRCLRSVVPDKVPGIVFLSGGQNDVEATERLRAICHVGSVPWTLSFSFGRALQAPSLKAWKGVAKNAEAAQAALHQRAMSNSVALDDVLLEPAEPASKSNQLASIGNVEQ